MDEPQPDRNWTFITVSNQESRRLIKSHTASEVQRRRALQNIRSQKRNRHSPRVLFPKSPEKSPTPPSAEQRSLVPSPVTILGAGRVDPFSNLPIPSKSCEDLELIDHFMHTAPSLHSKPQQRIAFLPLFNEMRCTCFEAGIHDPAAFQTILAIASADISLLRGEDVSVQAITHNTHSIRMLSKRLSNLSPGNMDGTIATVALHIIFLFLFELCDALDPHLDALENMVNMRGGLEAIERDNPQLALLINLVDYSPPSSMLCGRRRYNLISISTSDASRISPVALSVPKAVEPLVYFDIYLDISKILRDLQFATSASLIWDLRTCAATEARLKSQLQDLFALGTVTIAWGRRRCEILQCMCIAALIYMRIIWRRGMVTVNSREQFEQMLEELEMKGNTKGLFRSLIEELLRGVEGDVFPSLAALMRLAAEKNHLFWTNTKKFMEELYGTVNGRALELTRPAPNADPEAIEVAGLSALFLFFNVDGK